MNISRDDLSKIICRYFGNGRITETKMDEVSDAIYFVHDLIEAEVSATKEKEPYAVRFIDRMTEAKTDLVYIDCELYDMMDEIRLDDMREAAKEAD